MSKIKVNDLIKDFRRMAEEHWAYEAGAAEKGKVDCSGAFVYAYRQHGKSIYHGSNRIAREYVEELLPVSEAEPGMAAFKVRLPGENYYDLPAAYRQGGEHYDGDLRDYYHIGLVDEDCAHVLNAQSAATGFVSSPITQNWDYVAYLNDVDYSGAEPIDPTEPETEQYRVTGGKLNLRKQPDKQSPAVRSLADGEIVMKLSETGEWMHVKAGRETGYCMMQFLVPVGGTGGGDEECITVPKSVWEALKKAFDAFADASVAAGVLEDE